MIIVIEVGFDIGHLDRGDAATLASANTYTDTVAVQTLESANAYTDSVFEQFNSELDGVRRDVDRRLQQQDRRIDRMQRMLDWFATYL